MGQAKEEEWFLESSLETKKNVHFGSLKSRTGSLSVDFLGPLMSKAEVMDGPNLKSHFSRTHRH